MDDKENSGRGSNKRSKRDKVKYGSGSNDADLGPSFCMTIHCTLKAYSRVFFGNR
jgi:hypothetical protein